jgi:hypothetical protein
MGTWRRFWRLNAPERRIVVEACAGLTATWIGLRLAGFLRWKPALEGISRPAGKRALKAQSSAITDRVARMQAAAARHLFFRANCLEQSLTLWWMLRRRRIPARLRIGARRQEENFEAHAWVEVNGIALNDPDDQHVQFSPFEDPVTPLETQTR